MCGNILKTYLNSNGHRTIVPDTVGVDCSGFVGSTCGISTKLNCDGLAEYGHEVDFAEIQPFDIIIEDIDRDGLNDHCYFYKSEDSENSDKIIVWDCTTTAGTQQKTDVRSISKTVFNRSIILRPYYTFEKTATHHRYYCTHPDCAGTSNAEASAWIAHVWETPDPENPDVQYCKICNFCSQHTFTYTNTSGGHVGTCSECSYVTATTPHELEVTGVAGAHFFDCSICGFSSGPLPHTFSYAYSNTVHVGTCSECGYRESGTHNVTVSPGDAGGHVYSCVCGYTATQAHTFTYTTENLVKHRQTCSKCGYYALVPHLFGYSYDANGHWQECSVCSFETASLAHNFVDSECTVCGCPQFIIMDIIAIPEEDEPLPVPEDQKATL